MAAATPNMWRGPAKRRRGCAAEGPDLRPGPLAGTLKAAMIRQNSIGSIAMDAVTPKGSQSADTHSHIVRPASMEWQKTRFPGCEAKTLLFDRTTGLMTALMRFAPGS